MRDRSVHRWAVATTALTFLLIVAGALVTSRDAGLAVPDWPLSFGTVNPPHWYAIDNVRTEHGHRVIAGLVAFVTVLMGLRIRRLETDPVVRRLGALAVGAVLLQALLGGLRVLHLSVDLAMVHGCLGQLFLSIVVAIAALTSPHWERAEDPAAGLRSSARLRLLAMALPAAVLGQLVIGLMIRHGGVALRPLLASSIFYAHVALAVGIVAIALRLRAGLAASGVHGTRPSHAANRALLLLGLVLTQLLVGFGSFVVTEAMAYDRQATLLESWVPTLHVALGAGILATSIVIAAHVAVHTSVPATHACDSPSPARQADDVRAAGAAEVA
jgi:cytochrome c oxidase assembly protein subunit 15